MAKNTHDDEDHYGRILYALQVELVKLQRRLIADHSRSRGRRNPRRGLP